jgi:hypothetical protein
LTSKGVAEMDDMIEAASVSALPPGSRSQNANLSGVSARQLELAFESHPRTARVDVRSKSMPEISKCARDRGEDTVPGDLHEALQV